MAFAILLGCTAMSGILSVADTIVSTARVSFIACCRAGSMASAPSSSMESESTLTASIISPTRLKSRTFPPVIFSRGRYETPNKTATAINTTATTAQGPRLLCFLPSEFSSLTLFSVSGISFSSFSSCDISNLLH